MVVDDSVGTILSELNIISSKDASVDREISVLERLPCVVLSCIDSADEASSGTCVEDTCVELYVAPSVGDESEELDIISFLSLSARLSCDKGSIPTALFINWKWAIGLGFKGEGVVS